MGLKEFFNKFSTKSGKQSITGDPTALAAEKAEATAAGVPWIGVVRMEIDPNDISSGFFEFDWNDAFITKLVRSGYQGKTQQALVDQWFAQICKGVVSGDFEQEMADPEKRSIVQKKRRDDGRTEVS